MNWVEIALYAGIAVFFAVQLFRVLGRKEGSMGAAPRTEPDLRPEPVSTPPRDETPRFTGPAGYKLRRLYEADNDFDPSDFLDNAKAAYEIIITAFADGDRRALAGLLRADVLELYESAIAARAPGVSAPRLNRLRHAEIRDADIRENLASVAVGFDSELLLDGGELRNAHELWTFERPIKSASPVWVLAGVEPLDA